MDADGKHYITIFMLVQLPKSAAPKNLEPKKCAGWRWVSCNRRGVPNHGHCVCIVRVLSFSPSLWLRLMSKLMSERRIRPGADIEGMPNARLFVPVISLLANGYRPPRCCSPCSACCCC